MILTPVHKPQTFGSVVALRIRAAAPSVEVGHDARAYCPRHGARLIAGNCPFCRPASSTFQVAA